MARARSYRGRAPIRSPCSYRTPARLLRLQAVWGWSGPKRVLSAALFDDRSARLGGDGLVVLDGDGHRRGCADRWCGRRCAGGGGGVDQSRVSSAAARLAQASSTRVLPSAAAAMSAAVAALLSLRGSPPATRCSRAMASSANSGSVRPTSLRWWAR